MTKKKFLRCFWQLLIFALALCTRKYFVVFLRFLRNLFFEWLSVGPGLFLLQFYGPWMNAVTSWSSLDGCCYFFLMAPAWLLFIPGAPWMNAANAWHTLDACSYCQVVPTEADRQK